MSCASGDGSCEAALKAITGKLDAIEARVDAIQKSMRDHAAATDAKLNAMEPRMIGKLQTLILHAIGQSGTSAIVPRHQRTDATVARQDHDAAETGDADDGPAAVASSHGEAPQHHMTREGVAKLGLAAGGTGGARRMLPASSAAAGSSCRTWVVKVLLLGENLGQLCTASSSVCAELQGNSLPLQLHVILCTG
jgi:hypothetical protein